MYLPAIVLKASLLLPVVVAGLVSLPPSPDSSELNNATMDTAALAPLSPPKESSILPGNPTWCKYKHGFFENWVAVYSRDWGYDDHMRGFLDNLRGDCARSVKKWECARHGEHGAYATFELPYILVSAAKTRSCVASAFRKASPPSKRQDIECCEIGDSDCAERSMRHYFGHPDASKPPSV